LKNVLNGFIIDETETSKYSNKTVSIEEALFEPSFFKISSSGMGASKESKVLQWAESVSNWLIKSANSSSEVG